MGVRQMKLQDQERVFENLQAAYDVELKECDACHDEEFD